MKLSDFMVNDGFAHEITLSNGKKYYTSVHSSVAINALTQGLSIELVRYVGCCIGTNINQRAKAKHNYPIEINGTDIYTFIDKVADDGEPIE